MSAVDLTQRAVPTQVGPLSYWTLPEPEPSDRPVLLVMAGSFMTSRTLNRIPRLLADQCQVVLVELPTTTPFEIPNLTAPRVAEAFSQFVHRAFRGRPMVVLAFADAAVVAVSMRAPEILRIVAVEPPVRSEKLWPLRAALATRAQEAGVAFRRFLDDIYGVGGRNPGPRDHRPAFQAPQAPVDVLVGELPLMPERAVQKAPSLVDEEDRAWLAAQSQVSLRVAPGAGHDLAREAGGLVLDAARNALAWAAGFRRPGGQMVRRLIDATPGSAGHVLFQGPNAEAFRLGFEARNPQARIDGEPRPDILYDAIVLVEPNADALRTGDLPDRLAPGGCVVAGAQLGSAQRLVGEALSERGLTLLPGDRVLTAVGTALVRADRPSAPSLSVTVVAYVRSLMDIRTRLPALGLRSLPDVELEYQGPPFAQPGGAPPGVVVMSRPAEWTPESWRATVARAILARQVLVIEYDDHPELVAQMTRGASVPERDWERFRIVHAIQTSTEPLVDLFRRYNPEVALFPNAVFELAPFPRGPRAPRVFFGGVTRGPFVVEVARALRPAIEAHPETAFHVVGDRAFFDALPTANKVFDDYLSFDDYLVAMAASTISLSPLEDRPMVETKSDAKYLDAARAGLVTIASPVVYGRTIRHGVNGLIAERLEDWPRALSLVLEDEALRERIARTAWEDVREHRMFAHQLARRRDWYLDLLSRREELNAAILTRSPGVATELAALPGATAALRARSDVRTT